MTVTEKPKKGETYTATTTIYVSTEDDPYGWNLPDESGLSFNQKIAL